MSEDCEYICELCDIKVEHKLELTEHRSSLSHQIKLQATQPEGDRKHRCYLCDFTCGDLPAYSKHVDSDKHCAKLRKIRTKRIAMMDACIPMKRTARWNESPAYLPPSFDPSRPPPSFHPNLHTVRTPLLAEQGAFHHNPSPKQQPSSQQQPGPSNRSIYVKDNRKNKYMKDNRKNEKSEKSEKSEQSTSGRKGSVKIKNKEEVKKKKITEGGVISKVLSAAAIVKKQKKVEIVATPKVTTMGNKNKLYESLARKGMGMITTNKSRTQVMMMERQIKYSLVDGHGAALEDSRGGHLTSPVPPLTAPPPYPFSSPPHLPLPPPSSRDISFAPSSASDATYAFCHPMHSTPHNLHDSNWPAFVRGIEALHEDSPSSSTLRSTQQAFDSSYLNRRVKEEVMEEEDVKMDSRANQTIPMDSLNQQIIEKESRLKRDCEEQQKKLIGISARRDELKRRFEIEMKKIDEEEEREKKKLHTLESNRIAFQANIEKAKNDMKEAQRNIQKVLQLAPF